MFMYIQNNLKIVFGFLLFVHYNLEIQLVIMNATMVDTKVRYTLYVVSTKNVLKCLLEKR